MAKVYHPTLTVYTAPMWLYEMFNGYRNDKGTAELRPVIDPDGNPIIGKQVLDDPDWDNIPNAANINGKPLREWLTEIPYCYLETPTEL